MIGFQSFLLALGLRSATRSAMYFSFLDGGPVFGSAHCHAQRLEYRKQLNSVNHQNRNQLRKGTNTMGMDLSDNVEAAAVELEQTLLDDLTARGLIQPIFLKKAKAYANFWRQKAALDLDIEERGVMVWDEKRQTLVDNPAVGKAVQIENMMQTIFRDLGFRDVAINAAKAAAETGGGSDDLLA